MLPDPGSAAREKSMTPPKRLEASALLEGMVEEAHNRVLYLQLKVMELLKTVVEIPFGLPVSTAFNLYEMEEGVDIVSDIEGEMPMSPEEDEDTL
jgi:hypothetical protein